MIIKGKYKNKEVEVSQWGIDWFTMKSGDPRIDFHPFTPTSLSFTKEGIDEIYDNPINLLEEYEPVEVETNTEYKHTFKKKIKK